MLPIVGFAIVAAIICVVLRQYKPEYAVFVSLVAGAMIVLMLLADMLVLISEIERIVSGTIIGEEYMQILIRTLGICFITQIACDACKDAGESAMSSKIEMAGKVAVLLTSLPLFRQVLTFVSMLMRN